MRKSSKSGNTKSYIHIITSDLICAMLLFLFAPRRSYDTLFEINKLRLVPHLS
jgi:hypothetical protein